MKVIATIAIGEHTDHQAILDKIAEYKQGTGANFPAATDDLLTMVDTFMKSIAAGATESPQSAVPLAELTALVMCADPTPVPQFDAAIKAWLNQVSQERGYSDWVATYHLLAGPESVVTKADGLYCCHIGCPLPAEFEIWATSIATGGATGPDPYSDDTHACGHHVGALLGVQHSSVLTDDEVEWRVRTVEQSVAES